MSQDNLNAEGAETQSPEYCAGFSKGKEDCQRGHYYGSENPEGSPWFKGYEAGWEEAFRAKVQQRSEQQPQFNFQH